MTTRSLAFLGIIADIDPLGKWAFGIVRPTMGTAGFRLDGQIAHVPFGASEKAQLIRLLGAQPATSCTAGFVRRFVGSFVAFSGSIVDSVGWFVV